MLDLEHERKMAAAAFAREVAGERLATFDRARWRRAAAHGILGLRTPVEYGGSAATAVDALLTFEGLALGSADAGFVLSLATQVFAMQTTIVESGSPAQKAALLPGLCSGELIGAFAMSEPDAGSDIASIRTSATATDDGRFRLDGSKVWVTLGPVADVVVVFATTDPNKGRWGITAFVVPTGTPGLVVGAEEPKSGLQSCPFGRVDLDGCVVDESAVLGSVGAGASVFASAVDAERAFLYAAQLGAMERSLARCIERAQVRQQFGAPIGSFQAVSHRIAEMKLRHEAARLLVYKAAALHDRGASVTMAAALAKLQTSESAVQSALDAVQLFGAEGYTIAAGLEMDLRDAVGGLTYSGTSDIQRNIIGRLLGVDRRTRRTLQERSS
jgi:hypothetical protein